MGRSPGERAGLSVDDIVQAAFGLLKAEGLAAVSMRRIASSLGVAPNALYSHVQDKSSLLDAMLDAVLAEVPTPARGGWRTRLERLLWDTRRALLDYPDLVPLFLGRQSVHPNALRLGEQTLAYLHQGGVTGERAVRALQVLLIHTIGAAAFELPRRHDPVERQRRAVAATAAVDPTAHPHIAALGGAIATFPGDAVFRLGLRWLLDGMTATDAAVVP